MWNPLVIENQSINHLDLELLLNKKIPAIIIRNFYSKEQCNFIIKKIEKAKKTHFQKTKLEHIGPFLMSHITQKNEYFEKAKKTQKQFEQIFTKVENPSSKVFAMFKKTFPTFSISLAKQSQESFSPYIIRIHKKGKAIPIHKDNIKYEGKEFCISNIDSQLSCVIHLQESEVGGKVIIYENQWKRSDEKFREIDFGYSPKVVSSNYCKLKSVNKGDLVIINPNHFHEVTKIQGNTSRITLGMFLGVYNKDQKIVAWA
ncbi:hypothetical protein C6989_08535 [Nitrosopumilus sp. b2]|nr:hypothetical protein C6989_08535 [Nitrosopumilus sp. b2]